MNGLQYSVDQVPPSFDTHQLNHNAGVNLEHNNLGSELGSNFGSTKGVALGGGASGLNTNINSGPNDPEILKVNTVFAEASFMPVPGSNSHSPQIQMLLSDGSSQILDKIKGIQFNDQNLLLVGPGGFASIKDAESHAMQGDSLLINLPGQQSDWTISPVQETVNGSLVTKGYALSDSTEGITSILVPSNVSNIVFADGGDVTLSDYLLKEQVTSSSTLERSVAVHPDLHMLATQAHKPEDTVIDLMPGGGYSISPLASAVSSQNQNVDLSSHANSVSTSSVISTHFRHTSLNDSSWSSITNSHLNSLNFTSKSTSNLTLNDDLSSENGNLMRQESAVYGVLGASGSGHSSTKDQSLARLTDINALFMYANSSSNGYVNNSDIVANNDHSHSAGFNFSPMHDVYHYL